MKMDRIMLKLSGEALAGDKKTGFSPEVVKEVAEQVKKVHDKGIQIGVVIGGGNFWRGRTSDDMDRVKADQIGMLATIMNCIFTADMFRTVGLKCHVMTPFLCGSMTELFDRDKAISYLEAGDIVFFAGGTGHPYFSTDMGMVLFSIEIKADVILAAKAIDGVYDSDPNVNPNAKKIDKMTMQEIVDKQLKVIDLAAAVLAAENKMPMMLFGLNKEDSIIKTVSGEFTGTVVLAD
ncbi:uridylate kinase [Eubacterium ruminantium]|nr:uridylate kinase [Eubacterium ruminantium]